ncbi:NHL repeat-containing protein [Nocardia sp. NPDC059240]|uniref:NHL repeat-containing protein n=1 Tax=Nocardia sp. NPDC059240 TaxID=3346786 RepID=UPI003677F8CC
MSLAVAAAVLLSKFGDAVAKNAADSAWAAVKRLREIVLGKFRNDPESLGAVMALTMQPSTAGADAVTALLEPAIQSDPQFAAEVNRLVVTARKNRKLNKSVVRSSISNQAKASGGAIVIQNNDGSISIDQSTKSGGRRGPLMHLLLGTAIVVVAGGAVTGYVLLPGNSPSAQPPTSIGPTGVPVSRTTASLGSPSGQTVLPFGTLTDPTAVAVDGAGNVYTNDRSRGQVLEWTVGATTSVALPFGQAGDIMALAVDAAGTVYAADYSKNQVLKLPAGSGTATALPFSDLAGPSGVFVDGAGDVFVTDDRDNGRVLELAAGSSTPTKLAFAGLNQPRGVAVDSAGAVYVTDITSAGRVLKLSAGSVRQSALPFPGLAGAGGVAVNAAGDVYATDYATGGKNKQVLKLAAGASATNTVPLTGLSQPVAVAVDSHGNIYVVDGGRVLELPAQ